MIVKIEKHGCTPCKMVGQFLDSSGVEYVVENIDDNPDVIEKYGIMSVPVVIKLDEDGNEIDRAIGFNLDKLEKIIKM